MSQGSRLRFKPDGSDATRTRKANTEALSVVDCAGLENLVQEPGRILQFVAALRNNTGVGLAARPIQALFPFMMTFDVPGQSS